MKKKKRSRKTKKGMKEGKGKNVRRGNKVVTREVKKLEKNERTEERAR